MHSVYNDSVLTALLCAVTILYIYVYFVLSERYEYGGIFRPVILSDVIVSVVLLYV